MNMCGNGRCRLLATLASLTLLFFALQGAKAEDGIEVQAGGDGGKASRITFPYRQAKLERILADIGKLTPGVSYRIKAETPDEEAELLAAPVAMELAGVSVDTALRYLADRLELTVNRDHAADGMVFLEKATRFTAIFDGVRLGDVVGEIARRGNANIVFSPSVDTESMVFLAFEDVPWREALDSVLKAHGCAVLADAGGRIMRIAAMAEADLQFETRSRPLRYVQPEGFHFQPGVMKGGFHDFIERKSGGGAGKSLIQVLEQVKSPNGSVAYEGRTNTLVLRDSPVKVREMLRLVDEIDAPPRQVLVETRMLTIEDSGGHAGPAGGAKGDSWWPGGGPDDVANGVMDRSSLDFWLQAARCDRNVKMVQAPRILVLDNEEASVFIGDIRTYATVSSTRRENFTSASITEKEILVGVQLLVIPHVCRGTDEIILEVIPGQSGDPEYQTVVAGDNRLRIPDRLPVKMVHTKMLLHSTETGVISGLFKEETCEAMRGVPGVSRIPVFGRLFSRPAAVVRKFNSMILVTPTIIPPRHDEMSGRVVESYEESLAAVADRDLGCD